MSSQAQALIDDLRARREASVSTSVISPFPDIDRTLQVLTDGDGEYGGFSFNLDPKLAEDDIDTQMEFPGLEAEASMPFQGSFLEGFPGLVNRASPTIGFAPPPGLNYTHNPTHSIYDAAAALPPPQPNVSTGYMGSFNPFDNKEQQPQRQYSPFDDDSTRRVSRFGFARGKQNSAATSPLPPAASLQNDMSTHPPYYDSPDMSISNSVSSQWNLSRRQTNDYLPPSRSVSNSPAIRQAQAVSPFTQQQLSQFQPFDSDISEAQLRDFINSSRDRTNASQIHSGKESAPVNGGFSLLFLESRPRVPMGLQLS